MTYVETLTICIIIAFLGIPIFPEAAISWGISFVCSIVADMSSSKSDIFTLCANACDKASFVLLGVLEKPNVYVTTPHER